MKTTVGVLAIAAAGGWVWRRRRHAGGAQPVSEAEAHLANDPLIIERSADPDDIITVLEDDWTRLTTMFDELRALPVDGKPAADRARHRMQREVIAAVSLDAAEEAVLWPAVRESLRDGPALADEADRRGLELRRMLQSLDRQHPSDPHWADELVAVGRAVYEHTVWERTSLWPALGHEVDADRRATLGRQLREARATAPTRPHAATPGRHPHLDGAVARLDRIEDKVAGRG